MRYTTLGKTGLKCSVIGMGGVHYEGKDGLYNDPDKALRTLRAAYDHGVNTFDTAEGYGNGRSEQALGAMVKQLGPARRDELVIMSKARIQNMDGSLRATPGEIIRGCEASLKRLNVEAIDVYQVHTPKDEYLELFHTAFQRLKAAGKIRYLGVSTDDVDYIRRFDRDGDLGTVQMVYNVFTRQAEGRLLPFLIEHNYGAIVRGPLCWGFATGRFTDESSFSPDDHRGRDIFASEEKTRIFRDLSEYARRLQSVVPPGHTLAQMALAFVASQPGIHVPIPGAADPDQAAENARAGDLSLDPAVCERIRRIVPFDIPVLYY